MKTDYNNTEQPAGVMPGEYDVTVCAWDVRTARTGNQCVILDYEVRSDLDQPCAGLKVRYDNFTFIDSCGWRFSQAAMAAGVPDGYDFETPEDFGRVMHRRNLRITVDQVERNGKKYATVRKFERSKNPMQQPDLPQPAGPPDEYGFRNVDFAIDDDELPFN